MYSLYDFRARHRAVEIHRTN